MLYISHLRQAKPEKIRSMTKKVIRNFQRQNGIFFLKMVIEKFWSANIFRPPKLGAKSPPMVLLQSWLDELTEVVPN